jgi:hypothetical protein
MKTYDGSYMCIEQNGDSIILGMDSDRPITCDDRETLTNLQEDLENAIRLVKDAIGQLPLDGDNEREALNDEYVAAA